jgi:hypothetical protein
MRCAKCTLVAYVIAIRCFVQGAIQAGTNTLQSCQEKGWTQRGHKTECKILRDQDFCLLSKIDCLVFEDYIVFEGPV